MSADPLPRVLIIEADRRHARRLRLALEECAVVADIACAGNAAEAFAYLTSIGRDPDASRRMPELILLDVDLPGVSGKEVLRIIRCALGWHDLPVMVSTSSACDEDREACVALGIQSFRAKPRDWGGCIELARLAKRLVASPHGRKAAWPR